MKIVTPTIFGLPPRHGTQEAGSTERAPDPTIDPTSVGRLPGAFNLIYLPFDIIYAASSFIKARSVGDREGEIDATLRLSTLPLNALSSLSTVTTTAFQLSAIASYVRSTIYSIHLAGGLLASLNLVGVILNAIEVVVEALAVHRQVSFLSQFHLNSIEKIDEYFNEKDPSKKRAKLVQSCHHLCYKKGLPLSKELLLQLKNLEVALLSSNSTSQDLLTLAEQALRVASEELLQKDAEALHVKFLRVTQSEKQKITRIIKRRFPDATFEKVTTEMARAKLAMGEVKINSLARRVEPWCAKELSSQLTPLLQQMKSPDAEIKEEATKQIKQLLSITKIQAKKYLFYHIVSLCIFAASTAAFLALLCSCPPLIPLFILGIVSTVSSISYLLHTGSIRQKGWDFSLVDCIPQPIKTIYNKIHQVGLKLSSAHRTYTQLNANDSSRRAYRLVY